jgi:hypothetical protein
LVLAAKKVKQEHGGKREEEAYFAGTRVGVSYDALA